MQSTLQVLALVLPALAAVATATSAPSWLAQSWYFSWVAPGAPIPVPITAQCETIHVTWQRQTATGPDPVAPYYFQIYTSNYIFPFVIPAGPDPQADLTIPFAPGTQYQICMFDSNGNTGGCQAVYTVYPNTTSSPTCANWTMPTNTLSVKSEYAQGALSMYGWVNSCSDIRLTPQSGTPPFKFTVAPALHPPLNITSNDMSAINWTVALSWGSPFFISLVDSTGLLWSNGPIHSGDGDTACLDADSSSRSRGVAVGVMVGAAVGGVVLGTVVSILAAFFISKRRASARRQGREREPAPFYSSGEISHYNTLSSQPSPPLDGLPFMNLQQQSSTVGKQRLRPGTLNPAPTGTLPHEYEVEPFYHPGIRHSTSGTSDTTLPPQQTWDDTHDTHTRSPSANTSAALPERQESNSQVYVIHHDSGRAPVSVITSRGTEVVELPPGYSSDYLAVRGATGSQPVAPQRRQGKSASGTGGERREETT